MDAEVEITFVVGDHRFTAAAALADGTLTLRLQMPRGFLVEVDEAQRQQYGQQRDRALLELAETLAQLHAGNAGEVHIHH